jgi:hypothetical protein
MAGETEVLGENLPQRYFVHHKSHMPRPGSEPGPPRWEAVGGWVDHRAGLDDVEKRKFLILLGLELRPFGSLAYTE